MFDYVFSASLPPQISADTSIVWSRSALSPLSPRLLTPFSYSMLAEILRRGWYTYYDSLGCAPTPGSRLVRQHCGRAYLNLSISAGLDAQMGIEPVTLRLNGQRQPLAPWTKPGLLAGLLSRPQRKVDKALHEMGRDLEAVTARSREWYHKIGRLRWTQAEILQVMEEIERVGVDSLRIFFAARHNLMLLYNRVLWATEEQAPFPQNLAVLQGALGTIPHLVEGNLVESEIAAAVAQLGRLLPTAASDGTIHPQLEAFLQTYGHRAMGEGELRQPRWNEDPALIRASAQACASRAERSVPTHMADETTVEVAFQPLLDAASANQQKEVRPWMEQIAQLMQLQSRALHAYAYVEAGTRRWALAAAHEAMSDGRMKRQEDVFFFELEQVKEMMTGEWNISAVAEIHAHAQEQRARYAEWQQREASALLVGDVESELPAALSGCPGEVAGSFFPVFPPEVAQTGTVETVADAPWSTAAEPIIGAQPFDSGSAALLPIAKGIIGIDAAPLDPVVAAACIDGTPCVLLPGAQAQLYPTGTTIALDGTHGTVQAQG